MSGFLFATAFGGLLGGWIGDKSALFLCCLASTRCILRSITAGFLQLMQLAVVNKQYHNLPYTESHH